MKVTRYEAFQIDWTESESGWGQRPDGSSLHATEEDARSFINEYYEKLRKHYGDRTPNEYSFPSTINRVEINEEIDNALNFLKSLWIKPHGSPWKLGMDYKLPKVGSDGIIYYE